ncbi:hypothetical protein JOF41_006541 [Saccharothrix coeruleofusca]|nr:hypothetical protein [Saccharothrix coeruleofusca]MBP2340363.1 hypothetical protein [Saccharothrix coeruleofusca]
MTTTRGRVGLSACLSRKITLFDFPRNACRWADFQAAEPPRRRRGKMIQ